MHILYPPLTYWRRAGAVTLTLDPANTYAIDFDTLVAVRLEAEVYHATC